MIATEMKQCRVCGDTALYLHYGIIACAACKSFFKRHAEKKQKIECLCNGQGQINRFNRQNCIPCRLQRCFQCGMQVELIRHSSIRRLSGRLDQRKKPSNMFKMINLLQADTSSLSENQWALLTNLTNLYDLSKLSQLVQQLNSNNPSSLMALIDTFYDEGGETCRKNLDFQALSFSDRSLLLMTAIDNSTCLGGIFTCARAQLIDHHGYMSFLDSIYGLVTMTYHRWALTFVRCDGILFKLALALFQLSTHSRMFHPQVQDEFSDVQAILKIENQYVELTWKYLVYKYSFKGAVEQYLQLIRWFSVMSVFMHYAHCSKLHDDHIQSLVEEIEIKLILEDVDETFLNMT